MLAKAGRRNNHPVPFLTLNRVIVPLAALLLCVCSASNHPARAQERPQSITRLYQLLNDEYDAIERDKKALNMDCGIVSSSDTAKLAECRARHEDVARRIKKYQADENAFEERKARLESAETKMAALDRRIAETRKLLKGYSDNARLDQYDRSVEEWAELAEDARQKAWGAAIEGLLDVVLEHRLVLTEKKMELTKETVEKLTGMSRQKFLSELERQASKVARTNLSIDYNALGDKQMVLKVLNVLKNGFVAAQHMEGREREDYYKICLKFLAIVNTLYVSSPVIALAIADGEVVTAAAYGWTAWGFAKARIEQLVKVREEDFKAISKLTVLYRSEIDDRNDLLRERDQILRDAER